MKFRALFVKVTNGLQLGYNWITIGLQLDYHDFLPHFRSLLEPIETLGILHTQGNDQSVFSTNVILINIMDTLDNINNLRTGTIATPCLTQERAPVT